MTNSPTRRRAWFAFLSSKKEERPEIPAILLPETKQEKVCKKCGKEFQRGLYMHEKHCKGA